MLPSGKDDFRDLQRTLYNIASKWKRIGVTFGLDPDKVKEIEDKYRDPWERLCEVLMEWLKCNYNTEKFGEPTWRRVVEEVASPCGGNDKALAMKIANEHQCELHQYVIEVMGCLLM